jgi:N-methylhydantoinase A
MGGNIATTTDANLVLGRLDAGHFLGGKMALDSDGARTALSELAGRMGAESPQEAAWGVVRVANATMERAMRRISVERGYDPRRFALLAFGGAGPLHACDLAAALSIPTVLVPRTPGVLSALGMLVADLVKDYSQTVMLRTDDLDDLTEVLETRFQPLKKRGRKELIAEGVTAADVSLSQALDMRYVGQSHELTVPMVDGQDVVQAFHDAHGQRFGHQHPEEPVEIVNVRIIARGALTKPHFPRARPGGAGAATARIGSKPVFFGPKSATRAPLYTRERMQAGHVVVGPAVIFQMDTTTVIPPDWKAQVDPYGMLVIRRQVE